MRKFLLALALAFGLAQPCEAQVITTTVSITSDQLKHIHSQPIQVLPAPPPGQMNIILNVACYYHFNTVAYSGVSGPFFYYDGTTGANAASDFCNGFQMSKSQIQTVRGPDDNENTSVFLGKAILFTDYADYTLGDGTAELCVTYMTTTF